MPTIAHISDLHLQSGVPARQAQVEPILQKINEMKPDLVVISGDVTDDGWDSVEELRWAKDWLEERIDGEWFAVPGNHDVGNFCDAAEGAITGERVACWNEIFSGFHYWKKDCWAVVGINSMVLGSGLRFEEEQREWLSETFSWLDMVGSDLALFLHSPLFVGDPKQPDPESADYWLGPRRPRENLLEVLGWDGLIIGSGHVHQTRLNTDTYFGHAWAPPASGTWVHSPGLPNPPMPEQTGFFLHYLHTDKPSKSELVECAPMLKLYEHNP